MFIDPDYKEYPCVICINCKNFYSCLINGSVNRCVMSKPRLGERRFECLNEVNCLYHCPDFERL